MNTKGWFALGISFAMLIVQSLVLLVIVGYLGWLQWQGWVYQTGVRDGYYASAYKTCLILNGNTYKCLRITRALYLEQGHLDRDTPNWNEGRFVFR